MRFLVTRTAAFLIIALAVAACGAPGSAPPVNRVAPPPAGQGGPAAFVTRARQVAAQWDRSDAARAWRSGLVLLDPSELTQTPLNAGFSSERQKDAFSSGHFQLAGTLPSRPLSGLVRWPGGATVRLPLLTASAAFADLATQHRCGGPSACGQLSVTGAQPGMVTVATSRGRASVPAWRFTVAGLGWAANEVAVARNNLVVLPGYGPVPSAGRATPGVTGLTAVSAGGRVLTLGFGGGACDAAWGAYRYETASTVVAGS